MSSCECVVVDTSEAYAHTYCATINNEPFGDIKCCECSRIIPEREYRRVEACWQEWDSESDRDFGGRKPDHHYHTCDDCLSVRKAFFCDGWHNELVWEYLAEHIDEMDGKISSDCLIPLTPTARNKVCDMIQECWERYGDNDAD